MWIPFVCDGCYEIRGNQGGAVVVVTQQPGQQMVMQPVMAQGQPPVMAQVIPMSGQPVMATAQAMPMQAQAHPYAMPMQAQPLMATATVMPMPQGSVPRQQGP